MQKGYPSLSSHEQCSYGIRLMLDQISVEEIISEIQNTIQT